MQRRIYREGGRNSQAEDENRSRGLRHSIDKQAQVRHIWEMEEATEEEEKEKEKEEGITVQRIKWASCTYLLYCIHSGVCVCVY